MKLPGLKPQAAYTFPIRLRSDDVEWWKREVEPIIRDKFAGNRTAFIMDAVRHSVTRQKKGK